MSEFIKEITKKSLNSKENKNKNNIILTYKNKNDTFYLFIKTFNYIDKCFLFLYSKLLSNLNKLANKKISHIKKLLYSLIIFSLFFTLVLNENINISTDLLINAYFNDSQITHISYDKIIKKKFDEDKNNHNSKDDYYYQNSKGRNCKNCDNYQDELKNSECCQDKKNNNKNAQNNDNYEEEKDYYIFNFFPIKCIFITCFSFFSLYIIIKTTYYSRINNSLFINIVGVYTSFKIVSYLYVIKYFLACGIIFILFFYFLKCSIDSIYLILKYKRSDFEIFSTRLSATNTRQFILKFIILFTGTLSSGFLSIFYFQFFFNYIVFYICLFTLIIFICNCIENELISEHKYAKNVMIFYFGLLNFIANKIIQNKYYLNMECISEDKEIQEDKANIYSIIDYLILPKNISNANTLYLISDIFTVFCFEYLDEYIEFKYKNFLNKKKFKKFYCIHDITFHCLFLIAIGLSISGLLIKEYICFLLSLNVSQKFNHYFSIIFNNSLCRVLNHIILLIYIITQYEISNTGDNYLLNLLLNTRLRKEIINMILKIFGISILLYDLIYSNYLYYYSNTSHQNFYHYYSGFDIPDENINENMNINREDNNNCNINDSSFSEEGENNDDETDFKDEIKENFFEFASQINTRKYKIKIIQSNNDDNKNIAFYLTIEIVLCYIDTCIIIIFVITYEKNILIKFIYGLIIIFLHTRKYFILNEIKNNGQYYFFYLISFFFSIRLIILTNNNSTILNYLSHINVYILLVYYCFINKRNYFLSIILLLHLSIAHANLKSNFILFDIVSVLVFLLLKNIKNKKKYKINKYEEQNNNLSLIFLLSLLAFFLIQLYGINKLCSLFQENWNIITNFFSEISLMTYGKNRDIAGQPIEYYIIKDFINWLEK